MDYFLTTYRKDFKWPIARSSHQQKHLENENKLAEARLKDAEPCSKTYGGDIQLNSPVEMVPAQTGAPPQGALSKHDQPNAYLRKLFTKYPYLYNVMKLSSPDEMVKRVMSEKYKTTYQIEYNKEDFHPANDFSTLMDVVDTAEKMKKGPGEEGGCEEAMPECSAERGQECVCSGTGGACQCAKEVPVRRIAYRPAPISKIPQAPREKKKKKKDEEEKKGKGDGAFMKLKPFRSEYNDTIGKIGTMIIKKKLLHSKDDLNCTNSKGSTGGTVTNGEANK